jgi:phosphopantothenoylcysteine decarboxylase
VAAAVKKRGRAKRSTVTAAVVTTATGEGSRKRGRPKKDDVAAATVPAETVVAPAKRRGRKPTVEVAAQPVRRTRKVCFSLISLSLFTKCQKKFRNGLIPII